jgi:hypothetical protein
MSPSDLELSIFRTLCWFSIFDLPLSTFDLWKWLLKPARPYDLFEVDQALEGSEWLSSRIKRKDGMIFLKTGDLSVILQNHHRQFLDAQRKFRKLRRAAHFFQLIPGVQAVCAVNTLAWWHTHKHSDIDLYIVTKPGRIWSSRFLLVLPFLLFGGRPRHSLVSKFTDPFCFSFFSTTSALAMDNFKWNQNDHYLAYWLKSIVPVFDRSDVIGQIHEQNKWTDVVLPNACMRQPHPVHQPIAMAPIPIQWSIFEPLFRRLQRRKFPAILRELANLDSRVVITDDMLKFHDNDRRAEFIRAFDDAYERCK